MGAGSQTTDQFAEQVKVVREELDAQGRAPDTFRIGKRVYVHVEDDAARARQQLEDALTQHYGRGGWSHWEPTMMGEVHDKHPRIFFTLQSAINARTMWAALLQRTPPDAPYRRDLVSRLARLEQLIAMSEGAPQAVAPPAPVAPPTGR